MIVIRPGAAAEHPEVELATSRRLLSLAPRFAEGEVALRLHRPSPTMAFGRRDTLLPGYPGAVGSARVFGFAAVTRAVGGRAAAYHRHSIVMELVGGTARPHHGTRDRFIEHAEVIRAVLVDLGVDARVGEIPGEYCPGEFSVNARGEIKLMGAAQRVTREAWLLSAVIQVDDRQSLLDVTTEVYRDLGLEWEPATLGTIADEVRGVDADDVADAILAAYSTCEPLVTMSLDEVERGLKAAAH